MMHEFLATNRLELIDRCRAKVALRPARKVTEQQLEHGIPLFLEQLIRTLRMEQTPEPLQSREISGPAGGIKPFLSEIGKTATEHGRELLQMGFTIDQVVHDYGDLCQSIADLAYELHEPFEIDEFRTLNRCLDNGIADAVTEFSYRRDFIMADKQSHALNERLGMFANEMRNFLNTATLAFAAIKVGNVGVNGATGVALERSLAALQSVVYRSLSEVRITAGLPVQHTLFSLDDFITEIKASASLDAQFRECGFTVALVDPKLALDADRDLIFSAASNLLQNAFEFTHPHTDVTLTAYATGDRILIDVSDHCGGLRPGEQAKMFMPFVQGGSERGGLGLGLAIAQRSVEANGGTLSVRDMPGSGCVFTIDLPRHLMPEAGIH
ncbi:MAG: putative histidine kinase [Noviherbaspirillum sp.]|nr:putative histidine kinase [Noviherbaspirillum sp.]